MKTKKRILIPLAALALAASPAGATLYIYEPFDYEPTSPANNGSLFGDGSQSGALGLGPWSQVNSGSNEIDIAAPGRTFTDNFGNVLPVAGNTMERTLRVGAAAVNSSIDNAATMALTADNSSIWMTFLYQDRGFSGPDFGIVLASETMTAGDSEALASAGFGVGVGINSVGGPARAIGSIVYNNTTTPSFTPEAVASMDGPGASDLRLLAMKVNWNEFGTSDEIFVFDLTQADISIEPDESDAIASAIFNWTQGQQNALDILGINESQVNFLDEIRVATTYFDAVGILPIPEPGRAILLSLGGLFLLGRRRRQACK